MDFSTSMSLPPFHARSPLIDYDRPAADCNANSSVTELSTAVLQRNMPRISALAKIGREMDIPSRVYDDEKMVWRWETPMITAARIGYLNVVKVLLEAGGNVDITDQTIGKSPLHWACKGGHYDVAQYMIARGANVNKTDFYNETPIVEAIGHRNQNILALLVSKGADLDVKINYDRDSALLFALLINEIGMARFLLQAGSNVHVVNREGEDPLLVSLMNMTRDDCCPIDTANMVQMLLLAQCKVFDKHLRACFKQETEEVKDMINIQCNEPFRLANLCRNRIRNVLTIKANGKTILPAICELPLPKWLVEYVMFEKL